MPSQEHGKRAHSPAETSGSTSDNVEALRCHAYDKACSDLLRAIDKASKSIELEADPNDYDDAVIIESFP